MRYRFSDCELDLDGHAFRRGGREVHVEPQVFDLLALLAENDGALVTYDTLIENVWDGRIVSDGTLNSRVNAVRRAVGDDGQSQDIIRTFPRRGIRFIADVTEEDQTGANDTTPIAIPEQPSIVVMPLENLSGDPEQEYFSDGITEDLITALSHIGQFFVISRASSFFYKTQKVSVGKVAEDLGVRYVLEGSVRKSGERVRISAQLVDGLSGNTLWAESYDRELKDIFALQDEITATIVGTLAPTLIIADANRASRMPDENLEAWDLYQRGNYYYYKHTKEGFVEARKWYELAIDKDPELVYAYCALAELYFLDSIWRIFSTHEAAVDQSMLLARKAVSIDRNSSHAHAALGRALMAKGMGTGDYESAISALEFALSINPNFAHFHYLLGRALVYAGDADRSRAHLKSAMRLSPRDRQFGLMLAGLGEAAFIENDYEACVYWMEKSIRSLPTLTWVARSTYVAALAHLNRTEDAQLALNELLELVPDFTAEWVKNKLKCAFQEEILKGLAKVEFPES